MSKLVVSVVMITYGHEKFIRQAIEGVLMQECSFEVELILANDCSPDKTEDIILDILKHHPNSHCINYIKHKENIGMMPNFIFALQQAKGKYIALCDGDDYWTEPLKLQKQIDFLEKNNSYSACFTNVNLQSGKDITIGALKEKHKKDSDALTVFKNLWIPTLTVVLKKECLHYPLPEQFTKVHTGDLFLFYLLAQKGKIGYLDIVTGVYRQHKKGAWSGYDAITQIEKRILSFELIRDSFWDNKKVYNILSSKIAENKWLKVKYFFNHRDIPKFVKQYLLFFLNYPILGIKKGAPMFLSLLKK